MDLLDRFQTHLRALPLAPGRALVAVSGGPDSLALLDLLARSPAEHRQMLVVAHVDHGIHPDSAAVAARVRAAAGARGFPCESGELGLGMAAGETMARAARHAWLARTAARLDADVVFLGHHADDQAETILMRVLAGSGIAGLAGMPSVAGRLVRPLLPFSRIELAEYVYGEGLSVWIDPANADPRHLRSWIRCDLLPPIRQRVPDVDHRLRRLGRAAARQRAAWDDVLDRLPGLEPRLEEDAISVAGAPLREYDSALSEAVLMAAGRRIGCPVGPVRAARILRLAARGVSGAGVSLGSGWRADLSFGRLRLARAVEAGEEPPWVMEQASGERLWGRWRLRWRPDTAPERQERTAFVAWFSPGPIEVRPWKPGDRVRPLAGSGRRLVVRIFQERRVPRRRRPAWPVLSRNGTVVWVPGVCRSDALLPPGGTEAVRVDAEYA
ncbi:MAG TPA: tRNA lysidine(34) synthetase TilS [Gemmatimonadales bacterium]|nr:tRNA lysidine(34) synthetase TilS [Gemmatimonadales bacterium]